uniref:Uncharacterized protein n=1 Tax=Trichuris muris TaxID=70415 RepID=A0A5S6Q494_TRIMR
MSVSRSCRRGRSAEGSVPTDVSPLVSSIEEHIQAALAPLASAVADLTREVQECKIAQRHVKEELNGRSKTGCDERDRVSDRAVTDWSWLDGEDVSSPDRTTAPWAFQPSTIASMERFDGDPKKWPTFIATFRALVHDILPSNAQRLAVLGQLLSPKLRNGFAGLLADPSMYYELLRRLRRMYGDPQALAKASLAELINLAPL